MSKNINELNNITIIGTGAWGTAISKVLSESGNSVTMFGINKKEINDINQNGMNKNYFGNYKLNTIVRATSNLKEALDNVDYIVLAIPSIFLKDALKEIKKNLKKKVVFINLVKGIDPVKKKPWSLTISKIMAEKSLGVVSLIGPSFAKDVFEKKHTTVNIVSNDNKLINKVKKLFHVQYFKLKKCNDEIGSEIIAAYKNLLAIGMGIEYEGRNSINTIASIFAQGVKEINIISVLNGGEESTILEYCGIGDILLTCTSKDSRNFSYGRSLYKKNSKKTLDLKKETVEGYTLFTVVQKDIMKNKNLIVFKSICEILSGEKLPKKFVTNYFNLIN